MNIEVWRGITVLTDESNAPWYWIKTELGKEVAVAQEVAFMGFNVYVPKTIKQARRTRHSPCRLNHDHPLMPGEFFCRGVGDAFNLAVLPSCKGPARDPDNYAIQIPDAQMQTFRAAVEEWHAKARRQAQSGKTAKEKRRFIKMTAAALDDLKRTLFESAEQPIDGAA